MGPLRGALGSCMSTCIVKSGGAPDNSMVMVPWQFLIAGALLTAFGLPRSEDLGALTQVDTRTFVAWLLIVVGAVVAYSCYTWLLQNAPISLTSTYAYVNPLVAMFLGWLLLSEPMEPMVLGSAALIIVGVLLVVRGETRVRESP